MFLVRPAAGLRSDCPSGILVDDEATAPASSFMAGRNRPRRLDRLPRRLDGGGGRTARGRTRCRCRCAGRTRRHPQLPRQHPPLAAGRLRQRPAGSEHRLRRATGPGSGDAADARAGAGVGAAAALGEPAGDEWVRAGGGRRGWCAAGGAAAADGGGGEAAGRGGRRRARRRDGGDRGVRPRSRRTRHRRRRRCGRSSRGRGRCSPATRSGGSWW